MTNISNDLAAVVVPGTFKVWKRSDTKWRCIAITPTRRDARHLAERHGGATPVLMTARTGPMAGISTHVHVPTTYTTRAATTAIPDGFYPPKNEPEK